MEKGARPVSLSSSREARVAGLVWRVSTYDGDQGPCWAAVWETHGSRPHLSPPSSLITCLPPLQRFRFCGDLDRRDWVLAEISHLSPWYENILKLKADAKFEYGNVKATVAVLSFILSSAAKHSVDGGWLSSELQQLGLPKKHVASLCHSYEEKQSPLQKHLGSATYAVSMRPASVHTNSRRCTQHAEYMESPGRRLNHGHMPSSRRARTWPCVS
ncbi:COMM domain-containing protein 4-like [Macaca mulatta]